VALILSPDEEALQAGIRALCAGRFPMDRVRALEEHGGVEPASWQALADTGVFTVRRPEDDGGLGLGMTAAVIVFEQLGAALVPGPLVATELGTQILDGSASGTTVIGLVDRRTEPLLVRHFSSLDRLLAIDGDGVSELDPASVEAEPVARPLDPLTPLHLVHRLPAGVRVADVETAERLLLEGAALTAALLVGSAQAALDLALAYAKERHQFGRPIGSFQAVKHILADMQVRASVAQAALYSAAAHLDDPSVGDVRRAVAAAKVTAGDAAVRNGRDGIQVHGGMGFTWEVDAHLHLKRAWALDPMFGSPGEHADELAQVLPVNDGTPTGPAGDTSMS
jgi:alkylation response protein AidB-like acyl-CoA dehydrogenase